LENILNKYLCHLLQYPPFLCFRMTRHIISIFLYFFSSFVFASDVLINGKGHIIGVDKTSDDGDDTTKSDQEKYYEQLLRFSILGKADKNTQIKARFSLVNGKLNTENKTKLNADDENNFSTDEAYIKAPLLSGFVTGGRQLANWGKCLLICEESRDRLSFDFVFSPNIETKFFTDKLVEKSGTSNKNEVKDGTDYNGDGDTLDIYNVRTTDNQDTDVVGFSLQVPTSAKNGKMGFIYMTQIDRGTRVKTTNAVVPTNGTSDTATVENKSTKQLAGKIVDIFYNDKFGNVGFLFEAVQKTGELFETGAEKTADPQAVFLQTIFPLGERVSLSAAVVQTKRFAVDDDFVISDMFSMFGGDANTQNTWGYAPAGNAGVKSDVADSTVGALIGFKVATDAGRFDFNLAVGKYDNNDSNDDDSLQGDIQALEFQYKKELSRNAKGGIFAGIVNKSPIQETTAKKAMTNKAIGFKLEVDF
jgi:hypothetical protein